MPNLINHTLNDNLTKYNFAQKLAQEIEPMIYIPLSTFNFALTIMALYIFSWHGATMRRSLRRLLICLCTCEGAFHLGVVANYTIVSLCTTPLPHFLTVILVVELRVAMTYRNYTMALLAVSRARILLLSKQCKPLDEDLSYKMLLIILTALAVPTIVFSILFQLNQVGTLMSSNVAFSSGMQFAFFSVQGVVPIILVGVSTIITLGSLNFCKCSTLPCSRDRRVSLIIPALSVSFIILQLPTVITGFCGQFDPIFELLVNILVELDSMVHFLIYALMTRTFRGVWYYGMRLVKRRSVGTMNFCLVRSQSGNHWIYIHLGSQNSGDFVSDSETGQKQQHPSTTHATSENLVEIEYTV